MLMDLCFVELNQLTGIAAILTFPLDVEVVEAEELAAKVAEDEAKQQADAADTMAHQIDLRK
jgi:protein pelota